MKYKIYIGADHRGVALKAKIIKSLSGLGYSVTDAGSFNDEPCDYPGISFDVAEHVAKDVNARGILLCMTGIGHSIAANKVKGAYAALCYSKETAILSRQHNNSNVLVLGANFVAENEMPGIIKAWLETEFEGGRHLRRTDQIKDREAKFLKG